MNLALAITASTYRAPLQHLPACKHDARIVSALLEVDADYDDKLILDDIQSSAEIKGRLTEFVTRHRNAEVDKVFLYFSGHGAFEGEGFSYLLPDYNSKQRLQTSLENSEIDELLRGLKPKLVVKMIDACHSGVPYIKEADAFAKYLKGTKEAFLKCYFMFSSQSDQASYQNENFSFFTRTFAEAIVNHPTESIRLKDIIDYVSDEFEGNSLQTPFFVAQADFTELFCKITPTLRSRLSAVLSGTGVIPAAESIGLQAGAGIGELVAAEAKLYCTEEEATAILQRLAKRATKMCHDPEAARLYEVSCNEMADYSKLPGHLGIANWLDKNKNELFAEVIANERMEEYDLTLTDLMNRNILGLSDISKKSSRRKVRSVTGFKPTVALPYNYLALTTAPKYPNIHSTAFFVVPLISETDIRLFGGFGSYEKKGWKDLVLTGQVKWKTASAKLKDEVAIEDLLKRWLSEFWRFTLDPIKGRFGLLKDDQLQNQEAKVGAPDTPEKPSGDSQEEAKPGP